MGEPTHEERTRAQLLALDVTLVEVARTAFRELKLSEKKQGKAAKRALARMDFLMSLVRERDADITQHLAIDFLESIWGRIVPGLPNQLGPKADTPEPD